MQTNLPGESDDKCGTAKVPWCEARGIAWRKTAVIGAGALIVALLVGLFHANAQLVIKPMQSQPGQNEIDTADNGGQIGGIQVGVQYALQTLRCPAGKAIVGMRTRRSDVLEFIEIACGVPACVADGCTWDNAMPLSAGNPGGGIVQSPMLCKHDEMLSGIRGRVLTISPPGVGYNFDYVADIEIECARMISQGSMYGVDARSATWLHPSGHLEMASGAYLSNSISCKSTGGATAVSLGIARHVWRPERVIQAVSLYCPATLQAPPRFTALPKPYSELSPGAQAAARTCFQKVNDPVKDWRIIELCILKTVDYDTNKLPNLFNGNVVAWGGSDPSYNCYAYAIPTTPLEWIGNRVNGPGDVSLRGDRDLFSLFTNQGWTDIPVTLSPLAPGEDRAVLYATRGPQGFMYQHAAVWTNKGVYAKMGELGVFRFDSINQMTGGDFGQVVKMFKRVAQ